MIDPRTTRLIRVPDLPAFQQAVIDLACAHADRRTAVIVPTRSAAAELRRTIENVLLLGRRTAAIVLPDLVTRADLYTRLASQLPDALPLATEFEREVLFRLAARLVQAAGIEAPFRLRPGLTAEILGFYDELRRNHRTIDDFHRLVTGELQPVADTDRGAGRLLAQAEFLAASLAEFEARLAASGRVDEHGMRSLLLQRSAMPGYDRVVVAVADREADAHGLWPADFDFLARVPGIRDIDVVATERLLASGFHQRLHDRHLPGIVEQRQGTDAAPPVLVAPEDAGSGPFETHRDREEELVAVARRVKTADSGPPLDRVGVIFQRPLPYLYLARHVFGDAHVPYQTTDALPLAAEPFAAAIDLVLGFIGSEGTRTSIVELMRSPHWAFTDSVSGRPIGTEDVAALDAFMREVKYLGGWASLRLLAEGRDTNLGGARARASAALRGAAAVGAELHSVAGASHASEQIGTLLRFIAAHARPPHAGAAWHPRDARARAAVVAGLEAMRDAHALHDNTQVPFPELAAAIRRWIEAQTFAPRAGQDGLLLIDAAAAPFADVDDVTIVGLVDGEWPESTAKSIFFPPRLLEPLGWPAPGDRSPAARARFHDLLRLARRRVTISSFALESDAIVAPSCFADELTASGLVIERAKAAEPTRLFDHEALALEPVNPAGAAGDAAAWLALRTQLAPADAPQFHGTAGPRAAGAYAVSRVERYLECPFKYFAAYVLRLEEERGEESGLSPQERGQFLHAVFEAFFTRWSEAGHGAVTAETLPAALALFEQVAEAHLDGLPAADRALERTHLLGSAVAPGLAERAFAFEIEHGVGVSERLLEYELEGTFEFCGPDGPRRIALRAKSDRIDVLDDGTLRIVDYKIGRAPRVSRSLQLAVYSSCARQHLARTRGEDWPVSRAGYVAFREKNAFVPLGTNLEKALGEGEQRLIAAIDAIEQGIFPPRPDEPWLCTRCGYATVCRKDYVGDD